MNCFKAYDIIDRGLRRHPFGHVAQEAGRLSGPGSASVMLRLLETIPGIGVGEPVVQGLGPRTMWRNRVASKTLSDILGVLILQRSGKCQAGGLSCIRSSYTAEEVLQQRQLFSACSATPWYRPWMLWTRRVKRGHSWTLREIAKAVTE